MARPLTIAISGAAGQLGYNLTFRLAARSWRDNPIRLQLLELPGRMKELEGLAMELGDGAYELLDSVDIADSPTTAFRDANVVVLVGAHPRTVGMERADLLTANGRIFAGHGRAIDEVAASDVHVLVGGNPVNSNALVVASHAPRVPKYRINALLRLDHNRARHQLARHAGAPVDTVRRLTAWGNHSRAVYPDIFHATVRGQPAARFADDRKWLAGEFIPTVANRGSEVLTARGQSSQGSAAQAILDHLRDWYLGTPAGDWTSVGLWSDGEYGVAQGLYCGFPVISGGSDWSIVEDLEINPFSRTRIDASVGELIDERAQLLALGLI
ncbi:MAG: malate dehydrogenase [Promicromonosporaceae bacterium]|nr:malate dehydrogenase [Promicromonosporaceae bacterium]